MDFQRESDELIAQLAARLPELEWKINGLGASFSIHCLPKGLFRSTAESPTAARCVAEIKADIETLSNQENSMSAFYLATRIGQKINVLVGLCQINSRKNKPEEKMYFGMNLLSTRQQWIKNLELEVETLQAQKQAMTMSLNKMKSQHQATALLSLQAELGEVERRFTVAKETLDRAILS